MDPTKTVTVNIFDALKRIEDLERRVSALESQKAEPAPEPVPFVVPVYDDQIDPEFSLQDWFKTATGNRIDMIKSLRAQYKLQTGRGLSLKASKDVVEFLLGGRYKDKYREAVFQFLETLLPMTLKSVGLNQRVYNHLLGGYPLDTSEEYAINSLISEWKRNRKGD